MISLVLEAATYHGSAALIDGDQLIAEQAVAMRGREHEALMAAVGDLLEGARIAPKELGRVICGSGPGSFTSLRVAGSIAKGLAMASGLPLIPVSSLTILAASYGSHGAGRLLPALDAMRDELYVQLHEVSLDGKISVCNEAALVGAAHLQELADSLGAVVIGPQATDMQHVIPTAAAVRRITNVIEETEPADLAAWEPAYGRLAEAQVKWEALHGRPLPV
jgi:tRNA threonylcarbamoyladenosine biosynthesis protein TsaB